MKVYTMSFSNSLEHIPAHIERTAFKPTGYDVTYKVFPTRERMAKSIRKEEKTLGIRQDYWRAVKELNDTEGY